MVLTSLQFCQVKYRQHIILIVSLFAGFLLFKNLLFKQPENSKVSISFDDDSHFFSFFYDPTISEEEKEYRKRFNLIDETVEVGEECTLDYINHHKLQQDHPCVIRLIRQMFMIPPAPRNVPYNISESITKVKGFVERDNEIMTILKNKTQGFFIECGAHDGMSASKSLDMEMNYNWTGLLIEGSPYNFNSLKYRGRKAWAFPVCLSLEVYPKKVSYAHVDDVKDARATPFLRVIETDENGNLVRHFRDSSLGLDKIKRIDVQCFPLYSILLASNRTSVDYFSLDIEGHEIRVLKTIPWKKVDIKTLRVETILGQSDTNKNASQILLEWLEGEPGYIRYMVNVGQFLDGIYIKDYINQV